MAPLPGAWCWDWDLSPTGLSSIALLVSKGSKLNSSKSSGQAFPQSSSGLPSQHRSLWKWRRSLPRDNGLLSVFAEHSMLLKTSVQL